MLFGHFYHSPDPDAVLTRTVISAPQQQWGGTGRVLRFDKHDWSELTWPDSV